MSDDLKTVWHEFSLDDLLSYFVKGYDLEIYDWKAYFDFKNWRVAFRLTIREKVESEKK